MSQAEDSDIIFPRSIRPACNHPDMADLNSLLLEFKETDTEALAEAGRQKYGELYLNLGGLGVHQVHDDDYCTFFPERYYHAFYTTSDRRRPEAKDLLDVPRLERMKWILALMGQIADKWECWEVTGQGTGGEPWRVKRLYVSWGPCYLVWLEPKKAPGRSKWNFSTAYPCYPDYLRRRLQGGKLIAKFSMSDP